MTVLTSAFATDLSLRNLRLRFGVFFSRMWLEKAWRD